METFSSVSEFIKRQEEQELDVKNMVYHFSKEVKNFVIAEHSHM